MTTPPSVEQIGIRKCKGREEFESCVRLQKEVWGFEDADLVPLRMFVVAESTGGQIMGAFNGSDLIGYALAVAGTRGGHAYLHSHMLAVRESYRNSGLGRRLKLAQRDDALDRGFDLIEWTFDPLEIKNAYLNLVKLGAISRRYSANHYGHSSSALHVGLPTDRLVAEWWIQSRRVLNLLEEHRAPDFQVVTRIQVPAQIYSWRASATDRGKAAEVQMRNREKLLKSFAEGLVVLGYERDSEGNGSFQLGRWDESWSYATEEDQ